MHVQGRPLQVLLACAALLQSVCMILVHFVSRPRVVTFAAGQILVQILFALGQHQLVELYACWCTR